MVETRSPSLPRSFSCLSCLTYIAAPEFIRAVRTAQCYSGKPYCFSCKSLRSEIPEPKKELLLSLDCNFIPLLCLFGTQGKQGQVWASICALLSQMSSSKILHLRQMNKTKEVENLVGLNFTKISKFILSSSKWSYQWFEER